MSARDRENFLVEEYLLIPDPLERFQVIVETAPSRTVPMDPQDRIAENLVQGCQSSVWVSVRKEEEQVRLTLDSDAPAMRGVGALLVMMYDGSSEEDILAVEPTFPQSLGIESLLTPTRRRGLVAIRLRIMELVRALRDA